MSGAAKMLQFFRRVQMKQAQQLLWYASLLGQASAAVFFIASGLWRKYSIFTLGLVAGLCRSIALILVGYHAITAYWRIWYPSEILLIVLLALAVFEVHLVSMKSYRTDRHETIWILIAAVVLSIAVTAGVNLFDPTAHAGWDEQVRRALLLRRGALAFLLVVIALINAFYRFYAAPTSENVRHHRTIMFCYIGQAALAQALMVALGKAWVVPGNLISLLGSTLCFGAWIWVMRPAREAVVRPAATTAEKAAVEERASNLEQFTRVQSPWTWDR